MSVEKISPEQKIQTQESISEDKTSTEEKKEQVDTQNESIQKQALADAQSTTDKANQELAKIPQKIEDNLDDFNKLLKKLMGKNVDPKVDVNSPDFDINVALGDLNKILNPLLGAISPVETVVGKVPVIGDLAGAMSKLTTGGDTGGISKEEIKKLVPSAPEIPPSLKSKVYETQVTIQEFCVQLPMLLFKVVFQMLGAIYDMFDQIVGVIGVPPAIFPFSLVKQMPTTVDKIQDFATNAPSQIKTIVEGKMKDMMAASQALAIPKPPTEIPTGVKKEDKKEEKKEDTSLQQKVEQPDSPPEPSQPAPSESSIVEVPKIQPKPPVQESDPEYREFDIHLDYTGCSARTKKYFSTTSNKDMISDEIPENVNRFNEINKELCEITEIARYHEYHLKYKDDKRTTKFAYDFIKYTFGIFLPSHELNVIFDGDEYRSLRTQKVDLLENEISIEYIIENQVKNDEGKWEKGSIPNDLIEVESDDD